MAWSLYLIEEVSSVLLYCMFLGQLPAVLLIPQEEMEEDSDLSDYGDDVDGKKDALAEPCFMLIGEIFELRGSKSYWWLEICLTLLCPWHAFDVFVSTCSFNRQVFYMPDTLKTLQELHFMLGAEGTAIGQNFCTLKLGFLVFF